MRPIIASRGPLPVISEKNQSGLTTDSVKNHEIGPESCSKGQANLESKGTNSGACASSVSSSTEAGQANSGSEGFNAQRKLASSTVPTVEPSPELKQIQVSFKNMP